MPHSYLWQCTLTCGGGGGCWKTILGALPKPRMLIRTAGFTHGPELLWRKPHASAFVASTLGFSIDYPEVNLKPLEASNY